MFYRSIVFTKTFTHKRQNQLSEPILGHSFTAQTGNILAREEFGGID